MAIKPKDEEPPISAHDLARAGRCDASPSQECAAAAEINTLPPDEAMLLRLCFGLGQPPCTVAEAAALLGLSPTEAQRRHARALRRLRWLSLPPNDGIEWDEA